MTTKKTEPCLVFEEDEVFTVQKYLRNLACGRSPMGDEELPEEGRWSDPVLVRTFSLAADLLEAWLENGGFNTVNPRRVRPFELSEADRKQIVVSEEPVGVMTIANRIAKVVPYDMQTVRYTQICAWLQYLGILGWEEKEGQKRRVATPVGEELGVRTVERRAVDGSVYRKNVYNNNAQRFLIDNLEGIVRYASEAEVRRAAEKVEKEKKKAETERVTYEKLQ